MTSTESLEAELAVVRRRILSALEYGYLADEQKLAALQSREKEIVALLYPREVAGQRER